MADRTPYLAYAWAQGLSEPPPNAIVGFFVICISASVKEPTDEPVTLNGRKEEGG